MTTETIRKRWRAGAGLAGKLNRELVAGRATRRACEIERVLAVCRTCDQFRGNDCAELELRAGTDGEAIAFCELLCTADRFCRRWPLGQRPTATPAAMTPAASPDPVVTDVEAADRVHAAGVKRSQTERRAARRRGRK